LPLKGGMWAKVTQVTGKGAKQRWVPFQSKFRRALRDQRILVRGFPC